MPGEVSAFGHREILRLPAVASGWPHDGSWCILSADKFDSYAENG